MQISGNGKQTKAKMEKKKRVGVRVGDVEAGQVVRSIAEEVKQSVAGRGGYLWDALVAPGFRHY